MWSTSILSYNIWQTVPEPIRFNGQYERCKQLVQYFKNNKHICTDIIAFQELMVTNHKNYIINELYSIGYKYHSDILYDSTRLGKFVTGTMVLMEDGSKPTFKDIFIRSLCRLIPFEAFSFLGAEGRGWHDSMSDTYVVDVKKHQAKLNSQSEIELIGKTLEDGESMA